MDNKLMIEMNLPDFRYINIYSQYFRIKERFPQVLYPDTKIAAIYGNFNGAIWNGGRVNIGNNYSLSRIKEVIHYYHDIARVPIRFTFTNPILSDKDCFDNYCNLIAEAGENLNNEILVASPILEKYLRQNYPGYKYCKSIIAAEDGSIDTTNYHLIVMKREKNNQWDFLDTIPKENRKSIEFLCNDPCPDNCPRIYEHYQAIGQANLFGEPNSESSCKMNISFYKHRLQAQSKVYISRDLITNMYIPRGFNQFKCSGREDPYLIALNICDYMVLPEYKDDVLGELLNPILPKL